MSWVEDVTISLCKERDSTKENLEHKKVDELRDIARMKGVKCARRKKDMIDAIVSHTCPVLSL